MKKLTQALTIVLAGISLTTTVFASSVTVQQEGLKAIYEETFGEQSDAKAYKCRTRVMDQYGNILGVNTKWHGNTSVKKPELIEKRDKEGGKVKYSISRPYYYEDVVQTIEMKQQITTTGILLKSTKVVNTVTGKVEQLDLAQSENLYVAISRIDTKEYNQDALLKIQKDGTFKIDNLMDGTYECKVIELVDKNAYQSVCNTLSTITEVKISGNTHIKLDYTEAPVSDATSYYEDLNRTNPMIYVNHTESSRPPQLLIDMANKIKKENEGKTDLEKVHAVLKAMNDSNIVRRGTVRNHPVVDIIKDGKIYYESCADYANVFVSLMRELGLPATYAQAVGLGQSYSDALKYRANTLKEVEAHQNVEVFLPDENKWILVDPHFCIIITDYDPTNPYVAYKAEDLNLPEDGIYYFYVKAVNNKFKKYHEFTLENIDTTIEYEPQVYDLKLN